MTDREPLIAALRARILETLRPLLAGAERVALVDFPNHPNVGDSAIWLGELACLRELGINRCCYTADHGTYWGPELARRIGGGVILLHGGGNFGDVYLHHQRVREDVVARFPHNAIVQLPQSIHFQRAEPLAQARRVFAAHPQFVLLARDRASFAIGRDQLGVKTLLCPDMSFGLGLLPRPAPPTRRLIWLRRTDLEAGPLAVPPSTIAAEDWLAEGPSPLARWNLFLSGQLNRHRTALGWLRGPVSATYERLARARVRRGCQLLATGEKVVSDRLHAHILCLLMGIPHFLLDTAQEKLRLFHETWTQDCPLGVYCGAASRVPEAEL